ncbi:possible Gram-negative pili assembly chaperone [Prochlorococcus marinus str. NATL1A]|uniref:Possible Gram-negative pili assembly chaperone n=1 Tax=Prochlorococcus marinus (strain NATL1A) TaxID=167555 RepID=A2C1P3_PROM1|nr:possible Gram-negative pili assembly chaperone [Prochlorococcus marinus str. NATL1A]
MNQDIFSYSESIVFSLCKEIEFIKIRSKNINISLKTCHNKSLSKRLKIELNKLNRNRLKILSISESMFKTNSQDLSLEFLLEITKRSNSFQQI